MSNGIETWDLSSFGGHHETHILERARHYKAAFGTKSITLRARFCFTFPNQLSGQQKAIFGVRGIDDLYA